LSRLEALYEQRLILLTMFFFQTPSTLLLAIALLRGVNAAASKDDTKPVKPCTVASLSGNFYDLSPLSILPVEDGKKATKGERKEDWTARGYDYHDNMANFTLNICAPLAKKAGDFVGIEKSLSQNVSAYYAYGNKQYSLGMNSSNLVLRGRRLVLQYTDGSPCGENKKRSKWDDDDEDEKKESGFRKKSTIISFHCNEDPLAKDAVASFVGTDPDDCSYHFEVLSKAACVTAEPAKQSVGPGAVFGIIGVIAILVYFLGGVFYQRNVAHARGWRQLPNYSMWAGIGSFIKDMFIIATSSCADLMPSRRGYSALSISANGNGSGRGRNNGPEDENRLIDQLDEEWDD